MSTPKTFVLGQKKDEKRETSNCLVIRSAERGGLAEERQEDPKGQPWVKDNKPVWVFREVEKKTEEEGGAALVGIAERPPTLRDNGHKEYVKEPYSPREEIKLQPRTLYRAHRCEPGRRLLAYRSTFMDKVNTASGVVAIGVLVLAIVIVADLL